MQHLVGLAQHIGHRLPERVLNHGKAPLGLIHRAGAAAANFLGVPGFGDQALQALGDPLTLSRRQVAVITGCQRFGHGIVFLNQGPPRHFGGVRRQHQLDIQATKLPRQRLALMAIGTQPGEQISQHIVFKRLCLTGRTAAYAVVLLRDIGEVEELVEGTGDRQQLGIIELIERLTQLRRTFGRATTGCLGAFANALNLVEKGRAVLHADGVTQQLTELVNVLTQTRINFCHG